MTKKEFASQFVAAHQRMRETFYLVGLPVLFPNLAAIGGMYTLINMRSEQLMIFLGVAFAINTLAIIGWVVSFRRSFSRHAPACPSCGHRLTLGERKHAITKNTCIHCNAALFAA